MPAGFRPEAIGIAVAAASFHDALRERLRPANGRAGGRLVGAGAR